MTGISDKTQEAYTAFKYIGLLLIGFFCYVSIF